MFRRSFTLSSLCSALVVVALSVPAAAENGQRGSVIPAATNSAPSAKVIPMSSWAVNEKAGVAELSQQRRAASGNQQKAASDKVTIFRPLTGCRLYDSRNGNPSALGVVGGSWFANNRRTLAAGGQCGIPTNFVTGLSLAINVFNYNAPATGRIAMMPVGAGVGGNQVGLSSTPWFWTAATVTPSTNGNFDVQMFDVTSELIIDINGYYQDLDDSTQTTEMDMRLSGPGDLLELYANDTTSSNALGLYSALGSALTINSGKFRVAGTGVGSTNFVFQFSTNTAGTASAGTGTGCFSGTDPIHVITHPMTDNNPGAVLFITPKFSNGASGDGAHTTTAPYRVLYLNPTSCGGGTGQNKWAIQDMSGASITNAAKFNIMVITP